MNVAQVIFAQELRYSTLMQLLFFGSGHIFSCCVVAADIDVSV